MSKITSLSSMGSMGMGIGRRRGGGVAAVLFDFNSFEFTSPIFGHNGPTLNELTTSYDTASNPWLTDTQYFNVVTQGIQQWTVPETASYRITALGATGGIHGGSYFPSFPGAGATAVGEVSLSAGQILNIVVGQKPSSIQSSNGNGAGGGGGSWVYEGAVGGSGLIIVAGGGGGTGHGSGTSASGGNGKGGSSTTNSNESGIDELFGVNQRRGAGSGGNLGISQGGRAGSNDLYGWGGGGAGWTSNGQDSSNSKGLGGTRFVGGGSEDGFVMYGGFGGGGGAGGSGNSGGGAGGYTGGGSGHGWNSVRFGGGGGGGTFIIGSATNTSTTEGLSGINYANTRNGSILIEKL